MTEFGVETIYCDARALQDPNYRYRGVGQHSASLLSALGKARASRRHPKLIALVDPLAAPLDRIHENLFDEVRSQPRRKEHGPAWFLSLSPMTHDPTWIAPLLLDEGLHRIALFYDLIPLSMPDRYLSGAAQRIDYVNALAWLRCYQTFASISRFSADALIETMGIDPCQVFVTGVAVRERLEPPVDQPPLSRAERRWIVVAGGGDPRKNPECALRAHARSEILCRAGLRLAVFGNYSPEMQQELQRIYLSEGGRLHVLRFYKDLSDGELHQLYREGLATIVASRAEGFSIPIVESSAAGAPVVVSDVGAHPELIEDEEARFDPDDPDRLRSILERLALSEDFWSGLRTKQSALWTRYTTSSVGQRFLDELNTRVGGLAAPTVRRGARPQIAVLSPLPPAASGIADYTAATLRPAAEVVDLHMFTDTEDAKPEQAWASLQPVSAARNALRRFDAVVGVMGNSHHHVEVFDHLMTYGAACIAHDARQTDFYVHLLGLERATTVASSEAGRSVPAQQVLDWMHNPRDLPVLFLSEIAENANPLFVHSPTTAKLIHDLYDVRPTVLPFAQYRLLPPGMMLPQQRRRARTLVGVHENETLLTTFGFVGQDKAPKELIWTVRMLSNWGHRVRLVFCGQAHPLSKASYEALAQEIGVEHQITFFDRFVTDETYMQYLSATDVAIQLRQYKLGGLSGALNDCIAAGIPSVANEHLANAMLAPSFVRRVPDNLSPLLLAETILAIVDDSQVRSAALGEAQAFALEHSPARYSSLLLNGLGVEVPLQRRAT